MLFTLEAVYFDKSSPYEKMSVLCLTLHQQEGDTELFNRINSPAKLIYDLNIIKYSISEVRFMRCELFGFRNMF